MYEKDVHESSNRQNQDNLRQRQKPGTQYYKRPGAYMNTARTFDTEKELASKQLIVQDKKFFVGIRENSRGRFLKLLDHTTANRRLHIIMTLPCACECEAALGRLIEIYNKLDPHDPNAISKRHMTQPTLSGNRPQPSNVVEVRLGTEMLIREVRRYYLDLKENQRRRFLRITMVSLQSRVSITYPAEGMAELRNTIATMLKEHCSDEDVKSGYNELLNNMESKCLRMYSRIFYFDASVGRYGLQLRISEVGRSFRKSFILPERKWHTFRDFLNYYIDKKSQFKENSNHKIDAPDESVLMKETVNDELLVKPNMLPCY